MGPDRPVVGDLGEDRLLARIAARGAGASESDEDWRGDDAAVLRSDGDPLLFAVDGLQEGVDFDVAYASGEDVGWKSVAVNVSDVAAMGGRPRYLVSALNLPRETPVAWVDAFLEGTLAAARRWKASLVGGDLGRAPQIAVTVSVLGWANRPVPRGGARPGDLLCVTGALGGSAGGLRLLREDPGTVPDHPLVRRHLRPEARVEEGMALARAGATAMIDVSDGLALDLLRLMRASGTGCAVDPAAVPVDPGLEGWPDALALAVRGGEDYELLVALPEDAFDAARSSLDISLDAIGRVTEDGCAIGDESLDDGEALGWDHLLSR